MQPEICGGEIIDSDRRIDMTGWTEICGGEIIDSDRRIDMRDGA